MTPEGKFKEKVKKALKANDIWFFVKEARGLRGLPDIIGVVNGRFFAWELKKDEKGLNHKVGRHILQRHILGLIVKHGGIGKFVYPSNLDESLAELLSIKRQ